MHSLPTGQRISENVSSPSLGLALGIDQARVGSRFAQLGFFDKSDDAAPTGPITIGSASVTVVMGGPDHARISVCSLQSVILDHYRYTVMRANHCEDTGTREGAHKCRCDQTLRARRPHRPTRS